MLPGEVKTEKRKPRMILYGPKKIGKSSFASQAPNPIFVVTEDGVDNIPVRKMKPAKTWEEFLSYVKEVRDHAKAEGLETIVIDTINGAAELCAEHVCQTQFGGNWGPGGFLSFGQGAKATAQAMKELLPILDACRDLNLTVVLLAHTGVSNVKNPVGGDFSKYQPDMDKNVWSLISAWLDIILRAEFEHVVVKDKNDGKVKARGDSTRVVYTTGSAAEDAGCRVGFELPETIDLTWEAFEQGLQGTVTDEERFIDLLASMSEEKTDKIFKFLRIETVKELNKCKQSDIKKIIADMEKELNNA
jgi:hypothetical protein